MAQHRPLTARFGDVFGYTFLAAIACFAVTTVAMFLIPHDL